MSVIIIITPPKKNSSTVFSFGKVSNEMLTNMMFKLHEKFSPPSSNANDDSKQKNGSNAG